MKYTQKNTGGKKSCILNVLLLIYAIVLHRGMKKGKGGDHSCKKLK